MRGHTHSTSSRSITRNRLGTRAGFTCAYLGLSLGLVSLGGAQAAPFEDASWGHVPTILGAVHAGTGVIAAPYVDIPIVPIASEWHARSSRRYHAWTGNPRTRYRVHAHPSTSQLEANVSIHGPVIVWRGPSQAVKTVANGNLEVVRFNVPQDVDAPRAEPVAEPQPVVVVAGPSLHAVRPARCNSLPVYRLGIAPPEGDGCRESLPIYHSP